MRKNTLMGIRSKIIVLTITGVMLISILINMLKALKVGGFAFLGDWTLYFMMASSFVVMIMSIVLGILTFASDSKAKTNKKKG